MSFAASRAIFDVGRFVGIKEVFLNSNKKKQKIKKIKKIIDKVKHFGKNRKRNHAVRKQTMSKLPTQCPSCRGHLQVSKLTCPACNMNLEGRFELHELLRLSEDDLRFVLDFVKSSGSLKQIAKQYGQSYPTIRNRLNEIIEKMQRIQMDPDRIRNEILDAIARGELSVKEAAEKLKEMEP